MGSGAFWRENWRTVFGLSFLLGLAAGVGIGLAAAYSEHTLDNAVGVITTESLLGVGLLATVLAALAILATFFDQHYRVALRELSGGFLTAILPFRIVAFAGAVSAALGIASIAFWSLMSHDLKSIAYGVVTGATVYAVFGTWDLVRDTTFHGLKRNELLELDNVQEMLTRERSL
jgi:hypothetical protein